MFATVERTSLVRKSKNSAARKFYDIETQSVRVRHLVARGEKASVFVSSNYFQPGLKFVGKVGAYPSGVERHQY